MSRSVGRPATHTVSARRTTTVSRRVSTGSTRTTRQFSSTTSRRVNAGTTRVTSSTIRKPRIGKSVSTGSLAHGPGTHVNLRNANTSTRVNVGNTGKGPGGITQGPGNKLSGAGLGTGPGMLTRPDGLNVPIQKPSGAGLGTVTPGGSASKGPSSIDQKVGAAGSTPGLGTPAKPPGPFVNPGGKLNQPGTHLTGPVGGANSLPGGPGTGTSPGPGKGPITGSGTGTGKGAGPGKPPPNGFKPTNVNITVINSRFVNAFRGSRLIYWRGAWASLAALSVIPAVYVGGLAYDPYGYLALAEPACSGITPEGYRLTWRDVPTDDGGTIPQCVAYYPRGKAAPVVAAGAVPGQAVNAAATSAMAQGCLVEIFSQASFAGTSSDVAADQPRLSDYGWDKQISSLAVKSGTWDFYSEPDYGGQMVRLLPGQYADLEGWDKQISSFMCTQTQ